MGQGPAALADFDEAAKVVELRGELDRERELSLRIACTAAALGNAAWRAGDFARALDSYREAHRRYESLGRPRDTGLMRNCIGRTLASLGRVDEASAELEDATRQHEHDDDAELLAQALAVLGNLRREQGELDASRRALRRSLSLRRSLGDAHGASWMHYRLAQVARDAGASLQRVLWLVTPALLAARKRGDTELETRCSQLIEGDS
jgi:tetratricopeptide (TPR) repeat protein